MILKLCQNMIWMMTHCIWTWEHFWVDSSLPETIWGLVCFSEQNTSLWTVVYIWVLCLDGAGIISLTWTALGNSPLFGRGGHSLFPKRPFSPDLLQGFFYQGVEVLCANGPPEFQRSACRMVVPHLLPPLSCIMGDGRREGSAQISP